jgi:phosphoenolpyruvate carboxylase
VPKIRRDLDFLMTCFREVLEELGEHAVAASLPWTGHAVACADSTASARLPQAFSTAFTLLNMVEENAYAQNHRQLQTEGRLAFQSGSWERTLRIFAERGLAPDAIAAAIPDVHVEPVLTAHPTEAKRATILDHHRELYLLLVQRDNQMWTLPEQEEIRNHIKAVLERLWRTGEIYLEKPDVASEVRNVLHYLRNVFPTVLPLLARRLREAWIDAGFDPVLLDGRGTILPRLTFGNWVGGDRDGHPLVTPDVTRETLRRLRITALDLFREHLNRLGARLSLTDRLQDPDAAMLDQLSTMMDSVGSLRAAQALKRNPGEPWRHFVSMMIFLLPEETGERSTAPPPVLPGAYGNAPDLLADLDLLRLGLIRSGASRLARTDVQPLMELVRAFGFHMASLDIFGRTPAATTWR